MRRTPFHVLSVASVAALGFMPAAAADAASPLIKLSSPSGAHGAKIAIKGTHFQPRRAGSVKYRGDRVLKVKTNRAGTFRGSFTVPRNARTGSANLIASVGSRRDRTRFTVRSGTARMSVTAVASLSPNLGPAGTRVTVKGSAFKPNYSGWVKFNGLRVVDVKSDAAGNFTGTFTVPAGSTVGSATVLASVGYVLATSTFTVTSPAAPAPTPAPTPTTETGSTTPLTVKTGFESRGASGWTSLSEEQTYLRALDAASNRVTVSEVGRSVQNRPIQLITVGAPRTRAEIAAGSSVLFTCTQHGTEPAGREACLAAARDYANATDASTLLIVPTANPDGFAATSRHNANGVDINRDHSKLKTPEARALAAVMRDYKPDLLGDMHEYQSSGASQVLFGNSTTLHRNVDAQITQTTSVANDSYVIPAVRDAGFSTGIYGSTSPNVDESVMRQQAVLRHSPSVLVETPRLGTLSSSQRVKAHRTAIGAMMKMLGERTAELASTTTGAAQRAVAEGRAGNQRYYFVSPSVYSDTPPCGYRLTDAQYQSTQRTLGLQGITATPAGGYWNVSAAQAAQPVIGLLLDSRGSQEMTAAQRIAC